MLQLRNRTALPTKLLAIPDPDGVETLHVMVKATFALTPAAPLAPQQRPIALADVTEGDGAEAWLRVPSEVHPAKPGAEVLVDGHALAPGGRSVGVLDVGLAVGAWQRTLRVFGDRQYTGVAARWCTDPAPFARMPLTPRRAFGGICPVTQQVEPRNPLGLGLAPDGLRDLRVLRGVALPNVEDPDALLGRPGDRPPPALLTPVAAAWHPRAGRVGTYDDAWDRSRAPFLPTDFDPRFLHAAPEAMWLPTRPLGGEAITLHHLSESPLVESHVPVLGLRVRAKFRGEVVALAVHAETLHLFPNEGVATLLVRATLRCGHRVLDVAAVEIDAGGAR
ncbi:MAG: DUF2169 domain-containing protein [Deltaproteobacteria bacterium]|nr:DUF2169 domain-containing protein [Deltaproteobacteria bacterium]MBP6831503.1 DUF2169 domain-containing protein [Deltaproteobacteria bacterium]